MVFDRCLTDLEDKGYEVEPVLIPACGVGAPHKRERVWIVAHAKGAGNERETGKFCAEKRGQEREMLREFVISNSKPSSLADKASANLSCSRLEELNAPTKPGEVGFRSGCPNEEWNEDWISVASSLCRVDDGIPSELDVGKRIKGLGNAIVPQVAYEIIMAILETEQILKGVEK